VAVWQVPIEFVPAKWAKENDFEVERLYGEEGFDTTSAWLENQPTEDLESLFTSILPKANSWSEDLSLWGHTEVHDISVWYEEGKIFSIGFRLDLRENVSSIILKLCGAAKVLDCVLFVPGQKVMIEPNSFVLQQYILKSNAAKFVSDPEGFLRSLSD